MPSLLPRWKQYWCLHMYVQMMATLSNVDGPKVDVWAKCSLCDKERVRHDVVLTPDSMRILQERAAELEPGTTKTVIL